MGLEHMPVSMADVVVNENLEEGVISGAPAARSCALRGYDAQKAEGNQDDTQNAQNGTGNVVPESSNALLEHNENVDGAATSSRVPEQHRDNSSSPSHADAAQALASALEQGTLSPSNTPAIRGMGRITLAGVLDGLVDCLELMRPSNLSSGWRVTAACLLLLRSGKRQALLSIDRSTIVTELGTYTHGKRRIQWWTMSTVLFVFIKLSSVRGAPVFSFLGMIYVLSWLSVQVLVLIVEQKELSDEQLNVLMDQTTEMGSFVDNPVWAVLWVLCNFALLSALPLYAVFMTYAGFLTLYIIGTLCTIVLPMLVVANIPKEVKKRSKGKESVGAWFGLVVIFVVFVYPYYIIDSFRGMGGSEDVKWGFYTMATLINYFFQIFIMGFLLFMILGICLLAIAGDSKRGGSNYLVQLALNTVASLLTVGGYVLFYSPGGTYRPPWLDYIGM